MTNHRDWLWKGSTMDIYSLIITFLVGVIIGMVLGALVARPIIHN